MNLGGQVFLILLSVGVVSCGNPRPRLKLFVPDGPIARGLVGHRPCPKGYENCLDIKPLGYEALYKKAAADLLQGKPGKPNDQADLYLLDDAWVAEFRDHLLSFDLPSAHIEFQPAIQAHWTDGSSYWAIPLLTNLQMLFQKGVAPRLCRTWSDIAKTTASSSSGSPKFVLRGRFPYALTNDFLPILWANGGDLVVNGKSASLEPESEALAAMRALHNLARQGPSYAELLSTEGLRFELEQNPAVIAIEWSAASRRLDVPGVQWSDIPCRASPIHRVPGSQEDLCQEAGVLSTWLVAAPKRLNGDKANAVALLFRELTMLDSSARLCGLGTSLASPPVTTACVGKPALAFYATGAEGSGPGLAWRDAGANRTLLGRLRPSTPYWHEIDQRIGHSLNNVLLELQTEEQALTELKTRLSDLQRY